MLEGRVRAGLGARDRGGGMALGSLGAFLVLEAREHAEARGAKPLARLSAVHVRPLASAQPGAVTAALARMWDRPRAAARSRAVSP